MNVITLKMGMYLMFFTFLFLSLLQVFPILVGTEDGKTGSSGNEIKYIQQKNICTMSPVQVIW